MHESGFNSENGPPEFYKTGAVFRWKNVNLNFHIVVIGQEDQHVLAFAISNGCFTT